MNYPGHQPRLTFTDKFTLIAGVILPAVAITIEASVHLSAMVYFDPIPTVWHMMLLLFVPLAQLHVWFTIRRGVYDRLMLAGMANALVIGISTVYSILYLPSFPVAFVTILVVVGLLPLSPLLSLIAALVMRHRLRRAAAATAQTYPALNPARLLMAVGLTFVVIGLLDAPAVITRHGLQMAASSSPETRTAGIRLLRDYGSKDQLLRSCYNRSREASDIIGDLFSIQIPVTVDQARKIYYRVTGETFDMSVPPLRVGGRLITQDTFDYEDDQGGPRIAGKLKDLSLSYSELEGTVDADGGMAYILWRLDFQNHSEFDREARAEIQLPPGGIVSHVGLWRNGEERSAVFGSRIQSRQDYAVSGNERSPVLVTTAGRDRVLVQAFPVRAYGGEMKVQLGITVPLLLESRDQARLLLPHFEGRNFGIPNSLTHSIWFEAKRAIGTEYSGLYYGQLPSNNFMLGGQLTDADLSNPRRSLLLGRLDSDTGTWSVNPFEVDGSIVKQWIEERTPAHLRRVVLVVDTSASMDDFEPEINGALAALSPDIELKLVLADAEWLHESERKNLVATGADSASTLLASTTFEGGADNAPALRKAWDLAAEAPGNNAIVWIHSPQLVQLESVEAITRRWQSRPYGPLLYSVQASKGSDAIARELDGINEVKSVVRMGTLRSDLERLFGQLSGQIKTYEFVRSIKHLETPAHESEGYETSDNLARLWANDEITRILDRRDETLNDAATTLAMHYQLVTPVSNAAVVGPSEYYPNARLEPVDLETMTPQEPEIETLFLGAVLFVISLIYVRYRHVGGGSFTVPN